MRVLGQSTAAMLACAALCGCLPGLADAYAARDLGTLGGPSSVALALDDAGQVAGYSDTASGERHAFVWTPAAGMVDLGTLGGTMSVPQAENASGQVVGWSYTAGDAEPHAFSWTAAGGMVDLGTLGGSQSDASAINDSGQIVGGSHLAGDAEFHAFSLSPGGGLVDLGTLGGGYSHAYAVNSSGEAVGESYLAGNGKDHAFAWTAAGGMVDLGTLGSDEETSAFDVNDAGQVVGKSSLTARGNARAFLWTPTRGMTDLGTLGGDYSVATLVSGAGQVAGYSLTTKTVGRLDAFSWTADGGMVDLGSLGGRTSIPSAVNDSGTVVGFSTVPGDTASHAFSWTAAGGMSDLTPDSLNANAYAVNAGGQVAGYATSSGRDVHAMLWSPQRPQQISFTSSPPRYPAAGRTYGLSATGGGSGNPVTFTIDPSSSAGTCALAGDTVSFAAPGTCVIDADQAGDAAYLAAPRVQQTVTVIAPPHIAVPPDMTVDATRPTGAVVTYTVAATDGLGSPIPAACDPASGSTFAIGVTDVACAALDDYGNRGSADFSIEVKGADAQLADLVAATEDVGPGSSLFAKAQAARQQWGAGAVAAACGTLRALVREIDLAGASISPTDRAELSDDVSRLRAVMGC